MVLKAMVKMRFQGVRERGRRRKKTGTEYRSRVESRGFQDWAWGLPHFKFSSRRSHNKKSRKGSVNKNGLEKQ